MKKLMIKYDDLYVPRAMCTIDRFGIPDDCDTCEEMCGKCHIDCKDCPIQQAFERLAEYEATGITPEQIREIDKLYQDCLKEIEDSKRAAGSGWIPCSERLPENSHSVLICGEPGYIDSGWYKDGRWWTGFSFADIRKDIIAWQPLPEPYRPEECEKGVDEDA